MNFTNLYNILFENSANRSYSCLMLDLQFLQEDVAKLQENICPCEIYDEPGHGLETEFHTTVKYGIHEQRPYEVFSKLKITPIKFKFKGLSLFQNEKYDVLKFDIESKGLRELNKQVCDNLAYTDSFPKYHPHATVAYLESGTGKFYTREKCKLIGREFTSNRFIFSSPSGEKVFHTCK